MAMLGRQHGPPAVVSHIHFSAWIETPVLHRIQRFPARRAASAILTFLTFVVLVQRASALDPSRTIKQFDHTSWTVRQGAPSGIVALAQTADGYLWLGTASGLFRFDGVSFEAYLPAAGSPSFPQTDVTALMALPGCGLWIGYRLGGSSLLKGDVLANYSFPEGTVWGFAKGPDGATWMAGGFAGGLAKFVDNQWKRTGSGVGFSDPVAYSISFDRQGNLWAGSGRTLWELRAGSNHIVETGARKVSAARVVEASDGSLWWPDSKGVARVPKDPASAPKSSDYLIRGLPPNSLLLDRDGTLWDFEGRGILRLASPIETWKLAPSERAGAVDRFSVADGLTGSYIVASLEDREGNIWAASPNGLERFRMTVFRPALLSQNAFSGFALNPATDGSMVIGTTVDYLLSVRGNKISHIPGVSMQNIDCLYRAPDGKLWIGGIGELAYFQNGRYVRVSLPAQLQGKEYPTQAMTYGADGALWVSTVKHRLYRFKDQNWTEIDQPVGFPVTAVSLLSDREGRVWVGYMGAKVAVYDGASIKTYSEKDGLDIGNVMTFYQSSIGMLLAGQHGINLFQSGRFIPIRFQHDLKLEGVTGVIEGSDGSLWLNTMTGIVRIARDEIYRFLKTSGYSVAYTKYDLQDGLKGGAIQLRPLPSAVRANDGRLWFALQGDVVSVDPLHVFQNSLPAPVSVIRVLSDSRRQAIGDVVNLASTSKNIEIDYIAGSLSVPERVYFKYKMDDGEWQDVGTRRQAYFTDLAPGSHLFRVQASNGYGVWNETGASVSIFRPPTFQESIGFKLLWIVIGSLVIGAAFFIRMRQMILKVQLRMSERLVERERIARDLHDTLLQGFQGVLLRFQTISKRLTEDARIQREMEDTISRADKVLTEARDKVWQLRASARPPGDLASYLSTAAGDLSTQWPADFSLHVVGTPRLLLADAFDEISSITQEALANAFRHSEAQAIEVELHFGQWEFRARIRDNGKGLPANAQERSEDTKHWGLLGMQERAKKLGANFVLRGRSTGRTEVQLTVPGSVCYCSTSPNRIRFFRGGSS